MKTFLLFMTLAVSLATSAIHAASDSTVLMTENGKSDWMIVLSDNATEVDQTAAREFQSHFEKMSKAKLPIVQEKNLGSKTKSLVLIGNTNRTRALFDKFSPNKKFAFDEIYIKMTPEVLILTGHERRGALYAVYTFLEDVCGCRWWTVEYSTIPKKPSISVPADLYVSYAPKMISREPFHRCASLPVFSARCKGNGKILDEYGGRITILLRAHSFYKLIPPKKYFRDHPEWFSEIEGKRVVGIPKWSRPKPDDQAFLDTLEESQLFKTGAQLCLTNEEMRKELTKNLLEILRENPGTQIVDISQNDWRGYCKCPKCKAIDEHEESPSGTLVHFLNKVAADVEKEFPDVLVETLAYSYSRKPPKYVKPRHNILIRLCAIECSFVRPLEHPQNEAFASDIEHWSKIAKYLYIWDYTTNYNDYICPYPNYRVLGQNVRYYVKHGAIGLFAEGEGDDFPELRNWTLAHLMWNPDLDEEKLIQEFCDGYYGKEITPILKQYRNIIADAGEKCGKVLRCFCIPVTEWLDIHTLTEATKLMNSAVETAKKHYGENSPQLKHILKTKLCIDNVWLRYYLFYRMAAIGANIPYAGPDDPVAAWKEFTKACSRFEITSLDIRTRRTKDNVFDVQLKKLQSIMTSMKDLPDFCNKVSPDDVFAFDDVGFDNVKGAAEQIRDESAVGGFATKMSTKVDWSVRFQPYLTGRFRIYASLRCDATADDVPAIGFGVYDPETEKYPLLRNLKAKELKGKEYKWIDFGSVNVTKPSFFYFAHRHKPEVSHVYVDRVIYVRENSAK